jgi:hypothetical protein
MLDGDTRSEGKMQAPTTKTRPARNLFVAALVLVSAFEFGCPTGFSATPNRSSETVQATYAQAGNPISVTLVIYDYSTPTDLMNLSLAFQQGQDRALVTALSRTRAVGQCSIGGAVGYDIAFIQMLVTPSGRSITFITNRPPPSGEVNSDASSESFDLAVGQFDINDSDPSKSTGFLFPASKLVIDKQGEFHYDLAGNPWLLLNVLDSKAASTETVAESR